MPTQVPASQPVHPMRAKIRMFLRDVPGRIPGSGCENVLLDDVEFSDGDLDLALEMAVSRFNTTSPPIGAYRQEQIPLDLLLTGVAAYLVGSESFRQLRNQASVGESEVTLGIDDKHPLYLQLRRYLTEEYDARLKEFKIQKNMANGWGGVRSEYSWGRR